MRIVDDRYLRELDNAKAKILTLYDTANESRFNILLLSDIHLAAPPFESNPKVREQRFRETIENNFTERCTTLINSLGGEKPWHLLVNCGDIICGRDVNEYKQKFQKDDEAYATYRALYEDFAAAALKQIMTSRTISHILSIPGNHDVYRDGAVAGAPTKEGIRRHEPYYNHFVSKIGEGGPANGEVHEFPCVFFAKVVNSNAGDAPLAYIAVVGFDSNHEEYRFSYVTDIGRVSKKQLLRASDQLLPALKRHAVDAPLYLIGVMHHHILPVENTRLRDDVPQGREFLLSRQEHLTCLASARANAGKIEAAMISNVCAANHLKAQNALGGTSNAPELISFFQKERFSLVVHGHMHSKQLRSVTQISFAENATEQQVTILSCPSFNRGTDYRGLKGIVGLELDLEAGECQITCTAEMEDPADKAEIDEKTMEIVRPLISVSRVSASEMRLYRRLCSFLEHCRIQEREDSERKRLIEMFEEYVKITFKNSGYVPMCNEPGKDLSFLRPLQRRRYFLLVLLKREAGQFSLLLSRHKPLRVSSLADWDTLLLPAFTSARDLLNHLLNDILRQRLEMAERAKEAAEIRACVANLRHLLAKEDFEGPGNWEAMLRVISTPRKFVKFSPTDGIPVEYEYTLVTLDSLVARAAWPEYKELRDFINDLPALLPPGHSGRPGRHYYPIESLHNYGSGLRSNPDADDPGKGAKNAKYTRNLPHGGIWFPVAQPGKRSEAPHWYECPAIKARNADVMKWVDDELEKLSVSGVYPLEVLLREYESRENALAIGPCFPFANEAMGVATGEESAKNPASSTMEALGRVTFQDGYDLHGKAAYSGLKFVRAVMRKSPEGMDHFGRRMIEVFEYDGQTEGLVLDELALDKKLGVLRPVQRYVLSVGLERATCINNAVLDQFGDPWGYAKVRSENGGMISITPPIIEQIAGSGCEGDGEALEFIVVDGNHRIVQRVWKEGKAMAAVAVVGNPNEPFYAHPFSKYEWGVTAENELRFTPDTASKYAVRRIGEKEIGGLSEDARAILEPTPASERYRRYFRDLATGFGYLGGQGGRPA